MQKQKVLGLCIIALVLFNHSEAQDAIGKMVNLKQCVDIAIKNNLQIQQNQTQMETSRVNWKQAKDYLLPTLNGQGSYGINFGRSINPYTNQYIDQQINTGNYGLNTNLLIFSGLQTQNSIKQYSFAYDASKMDLQQQKDNITLGVLLAYLQVLSNQDLLAISRAQANVDSQQVVRLEIQNKEGAIAPATLYDLQGQYANDLVNIVNSVNALESSKVSLFQLLNVPYVRDIDFERVPLNITVSPSQTSSDSIFQTAVQILPLVKSADLRIKSYQKALQVAKGAYYPSLSFYGSVTTNYSSAAEVNVPGTIMDQTTDSYILESGSKNYVISPTEIGASSEKISFGDQFKNNRYTQIGLQLSIPIINYFRARNNVKIAKINLQNSQNIANNTRNQVQQNVELAYQNLIAAVGQFKSYQDQVAAYQLSFRAAEIKFNAGAITSVDYVIAKNNFDRANINYTLSRYNYIFRTKILDYYQGRLSL